MKTIFADAGYWIAISNPRDQWHDRAMAVNEQLGDFQIVTTQMVLVEFLNYMSSRGPRRREAALLALKRLNDSAGVEVVGQSIAQFNSAVDFYTSRMDKPWSLTDCASFLLMEERNIWEALAHDQDFAQAGFVALLKEHQE